MNSILDRVTIPGFLVVSSTLLVFLVIGLIFFVPIPEERLQVLLPLIGSVFAAWIGIVGYFFGSSAGSARKTELSHGKAVNNNEPPKE